MAIYYVVAAFCGILVSGTEIISRYRDEPLKAVFCGWGLSYLVVNAALSVLAFFILFIAETISDESTSITLLEYSVYAGFGAAVVMRAKIFNLRMGSGEGVGFGPDLIIDAYLKMLDRQIDRKRAFERAKVVRERMVNVDYQKVKLPLINMLTRSMQGITPAENEKLGSKLGDLDNSTVLSNQEKSYALGFLLLDLAGEGFFNKFFTDEERMKYLASSKENASA